MRSPSHRVRPRVLLGSGGPARPDPKPKPAPPLSPLDATLVALLDEPIGPDESLLAGFRRKERELATVFAGLTVDEARGLSARLAAADPDDLLAVRFARLTAERRARLLSFLNDAPRRDAMGR
ncbi:MAG: hypothetical protein AB7O24_06780 [Kofleriaceae bacterium]